MKDSSLSLIGTVYNNGDVIVNSIESLLKGLETFPYEYEIVIVDNFSTDSTYEKILRFAEDNPCIKPYRELCKRGRGRQIALEKSKNNYVVSVDFDSIYLSSFFRLISFLIERGVDKDEIVNGFTTRKNILRTGGWRDLNSSEDV